MTLVRYEPWALMNHLHRELDALLGAPRAPDASAAPRRPVALIPRVDVHADAERYVVRADLPGVQPTDIEVTADKGVLTIRAERHVGQSAGATANARVERLAGTFVRRFTLPEDANAGEISARSQHGVLELTIPKRLKPEPRRIAVAAA